MLRRLRPDGTLLAIEMNRDFVRYLRRTVPDRRLHVVEGSAADAESALAARGLRHADYVVSGIPYSTMPPAVRDRILRTTHDVLHQDGAFLVYQFTRAVQSWPEVITCFSMTGDMDYLMRVQVENLAHYSRFIMDKLLKQPGVIDIRSNFVLERVKETTVLPLEHLA